MVLGGGFGFGVGFGVVRLVMSCAREMLLLMDEKEEKSRRSGREAAGLSSAH